MDHLELYLHLQIGGYLLIVPTYNISMNTREDLLKWLDDNRAFKDPERKTLSSSIVRVLNKNENIKNDFKRIIKLDSDNSTELIYNVVFPNQTRVCEV